MSINVDKMDPKNVLSPRKPKTLKRRKKTTSMSDLSIGSISPKRKFYSNNFSEENPSSPDISSRDSPFSHPGAFNELFRYSCNIPQNDGNSEKIPTTIMSNTQNGTQLNDSSNRSIGYTNGLVTEQTVSIRNSDTLNHNMGTDSDSNASINKAKRRTTEDFYLFCQFILEYENYNEIANQEALRNSTHSPLDSTGSVTESTTSSAANEESNQVIDNIDVSKDDESAKEEEVNNISNLLDENKLDASKNISAMDVSSTNDDITDESDIDADSYNLITCYCGKPYAARPMIECSQCLTWLHLSCAKIKRKHIPDIFICVKCVKSDHPNDMQGCEPKENNRSKRSSNSSQTRSDKSENTILQPLNVESSYETSTKCLENIKSSSSAASISVKYK